MRQLGLGGFVVIAVAAALVGCSDDPRPNNAGAAGQGGGRGGSSGGAGRGGSGAAGDDGWGRRRARAAAKVGRPAVEQPARRRRAARAAVEGGTAGQGGTAGAGGRRAGEAGGTAGAAGAGGDRWRGGHRRRERVAAAPRAAAAWRAGVEPAVVLRRAAAAKVARPVRRAKVEQLVRRAAGARSRAGGPGRGRHQQRLRVDQRVAAQHAGDLVRADCVHSMTHGHRLEDDLRRRGAAVATSARRQGRADRSRQHRADVRQPGDLCRRWTALRQGRLQPRQSARRRHRQHQQGLRHPLRQERRAGDADGSRRRRSDRRPARRDDRRTHRPVRIRVGDAPGIARPSDHRRRQGGRDAQPVELDQLHLRRRQCGRDRSRQRSGRAAAGARRTEELRGPRLRAGVRDGAGRLRGLVRFDGASARVGHRGGRRLASRRRASPAIISAVAFPTPPVTFAWVVPLPTSTGGATRAFTSTLGSFSPSVPDHLYQFDFVTGGTMSFGTASPFDLGKPAVGNGRLLLPDAKASAPRIHVFDATAPARRRRRRPSFPTRRAVCRRAKWHGTDAWY